MEQRGDVLEKKGIRENRDNQLLLHGEPQNAQKIVLEELVGGETRTRVPVHTHLAREKA